jgi:hypothetical protein
MATYRLSIDDFDEPEYVLIAIHTPLEDYRLAFTLNRALQLQLAANPSGVSVKTKDGEAFFSRFSYQNPDGIVWELLQNKTELRRESAEPQDLFGETKASVVSRSYLLPEFKKVDYFLKIDTDGESETGAMTAILNELESISTAYPVDDQLVKSRNNLILLEHANKQKDQDRSHAWAGL